MSFGCQSYVDLVTEFMKVECIHCAQFNLFMYNKQFDFHIIVASVSNQQLFTEMKVNSGGYFMSRKVTR